MTTMKSTSVSPAPPSADRFELYFRTIGGPEIAGGLNEWTSSIRINGSSYEAVLEVHRQNGDLPGKPIGLFRARLPSTLVTNLLNTAKSIDFAALPQATDGGLAPNTLTIEFEYQGAKRRKMFSGRDAAIAQPLKPLIDLIGNAMNQAMQSPESAVALAVRRADDTSSGQPVFQFVLKNIGTRPLTISDPRSLGAKGLDRYALVRVAEVVSGPPGVGARPPQWERLGLRGAADQKPLPPLRLRPGEEHAILTEPWPQPRPDRPCVAQAVLLDYSGPIPPGPQAGPAAAENAAKEYLVRGACFSTTLDFTPRKK